MSLITVRLAMQDWVLTKGCNWKCVALNEGFSKGYRRNDREVCKRRCHLTYFYGFYMLLKFFRYFKCFKIN
ncbi:hypothetical protein TNCT_307611 [Trichonephila clavata]|uniref:Uncharacterized protein n=1 Tax=Trichonephila clavata TaxID=2740835 RepID=A0A8X6K7E6_TRICU|nr:hypothetical protein TNCT_307611 [Trichonephila clavata]